MHKDDIQSMVTIMELVKSCAEWKAEAESLQRENKFLKELLLAKQYKQDSSST
jgi:cell shape-determining protein MreC